jgi:predicted Zn-dependent protease
MNREYFEKLCAKLLSLTKADESYVSVNAVDSVPYRFAKNLVLQSSRIMDVHVQLTVRLGKRYTSASTNDISDSGLKALADRTVALAGRLSEAEMIIPFPETARIKESALFSQRNEDITDAWRVEAVGAVLEKTKQANLLALGHLTTSDNTYVLASSNGMFLYQTSSTLYFMIRVFNENGTSTGQAEGRSISFQGFSPLALAQSAIDTCVAWKDPIEIKAERLTTLFHPNALADLFHPFIRQFDQQAVNENRSIVRRLDGTTFLGTKIFPETINITSDPYDTRVPSLPFTMEGLEVKPMYWVRSGVIENIALSRFEAAKAKKAPLPFPTNLKLDGGTKSIEEIISTTQRALYVQGFAPLTVADATNCLLSGSTRDGLFLIEDGKITKAVMNLWMRETPAYILGQILQAGLPAVCYPRTILFPMLMPPLLVKDVMYVKSSGTI